MRSNDELIGVIETVKNLCIDMATGGPFSYEKFEAERNNVLSYPELKNLLPDWFIRCRYGSMYWDFISRKYQHYDGRRQFLRAEFDEIIDQLKLGVTRPITETLEKSLESLDSESVNRLWRKIISRSDGDYDGTITACKSLLESIMKYVLTRENVDYEDKEDLGELYKKTRKALNLDPDTRRMITYKKILSSITTIVQSIAELRNNLGDAHGKGEIIDFAEKKHSELVINLTGALAVFIIDSYHSQIKT